MKTTSTGARALSCALLATTALCGLAVSPAQAQTAYAEQERQAPDENGVDVISGRINVPLRTITAGRPGAGGLTYVNGWADGRFFDSFNSEISGVGGAWKLVTVFGQAKRFSQNSDGSFSSTDGDGATLTVNATTGEYVYTTRDGTAFKFLKSLGDSGMLAQVMARLATITAPHGEVVH